MQQAPASHQNQRVCRFTRSGGFLCRDERCSTNVLLCEMANGCSRRHSDWITFVRLLFGSLSVTNLCSLVLDRYIAVVKPLKYLTFMKPSRVIQMVFLAWGITVAYRTIDALNWFIFKISLFFNIVFWITMLVFEFLPCLILIFCFASMLHVVCKHDRAARATARQLSFNHRVLFKTQEKSAVKIMVIVIGLFLLCYGAHIRCTFVFIFSDHKLCNDEQYKIPLLVLNSAINPVAYAFFKRDIKKEIKRRICCVMRKEPKEVEPVNENNCLTLESYIS